MFSSNRAINKAMLISHKNLLKGTMAVVVQLLGCWPFHQSSNLNMETGAKGPTANCTILSWNQNKDKNKEFLDEIKLKISFSFR